MLRVVADPGRFQTLTVLVPADAVIEVDAGRPLPAPLVGYVCREDATAEVNVVGTFAKHPVGLWGLSLSNRELVGRMQVKSGICSCRVKSVGGRDAPCQKGFYPGLMLGGT